MNNTFLTQEELINSMTASLQLLWTSLPLNQTSIKYLFIKRGNHDNHQVTKTNGHEKYFDTGVANIPFGELAILSMVGKSNIPFVHLVWCLPKCSRIFRMIYAPIECPISTNLQEGEKMFSRNAILWFICWEREKGDLLGKLDVSFNMPCPKGKR